MQKQSRAGIEKHARQNRHPCKGYQIDTQTRIAQRQARQHNHYRRLQTEEQDRRSTLDIRAAEYIQVNDKQRNKQAYHNAFPRYGQYALVLADALVCVCAAQRLQYLIVLLRYNLTAVNDFLTRLYHSLRRRNRSKQLGTHRVRQSRVLLYIRTHFVVRFPKTLPRLPRCVNLSKRIHG